MEGSEQAIALDTMLPAKVAKGPKGVSETPRSESPKASSFIERDAAPTNHAKGGPKGEYKTEEDAHGPIFERMGRIQEKNKRNGTHASPLPSQFPLYKDRSAGARRSVSGPLSVPYG